jgi:hypothetical protein
MKTRIFPTIFLTAILCTALVGAAFAQKPGVSVGNGFVYRLRSSWASNDPNAVMPNGLADINMTDYYKVTVTAVSGANVSIHTQWHHRNGTDVETDGSVSTETTTYQGGFWAIIASNLNEEDRVHPNFNQDQSSINETVMWDYGGYKRETNHLDLEFVYEESDIPGSTYTEHVSTYFDKQTGALIQLEDTHTYHNPDMAFAVTWELVSQNAWTGPEENQALPLPPIIAIAIVALVTISLLAALLYRKKQSDRRK